MDATPRVTFRAADARDAPLLFDMLVHAANWDPRRAAMLPREVAANPALSHYVDGWPAPGDLGVVATDEAGRVLGAAWLRRFSAADPSYGYLDDETPELSIGVEPRSRGRGVGAHLCERLLAAAAAAGIRQVCLSVEKANPAVRLYRRLGFAQVRDDGDAITMVCPCASGG